jgi:hypothetical protein
MFKLKNPSFTPENCVNIVLHVTILFTILSLLFKYYISDITTKAINSEIDYIVNESISSSNKHNINYNVFINELMHQKNELLKKYSNIANLAEKNDYENQLNHITHRINKLHGKINNNTEHFTDITNSSYDYYYNLFSKQDQTVKTSNEKVFFYIFLVNILLIIIFIIMTFYFYKTKNISSDEIKIIVLENVLTFGFVGIIEYLFFTQVALKYIPVQPSLIYTSFLDSLKNNLKY